MRHRLSLFVLVLLAGISACGRDQGGGRSGLAPPSAPPLVPQSEADGTPWNDHAVAFTFSSDDGNVDNLSWAPVFANRGLNFTLFITTGYLGGRRKLTAQDVRNLSDQGFEIGSHSVTHPYMTTLNDSLLTWELTESRRVLAEITGKEIRTFAYPYHDHDDRVIAETRKYYASARNGVRSELGYPSFSLSPSTWGTIHIFEVPLAATIREITENNALTEAETRARVRALLAVARVRIGWVNIYAHTLADVDAQHLDWILDEVQRAGDVWIGTFGEIADFHEKNHGIPVRPKLRRYLPPDIEGKIKKSME